MLVCNFKCDIIEWNIVDLFLFALRLMFEIFVETIEVGGQRVTNTK